MLGHEGCGAVKAAQLSDEDVKDEPEALKASHRLLQYRSRDDVAHQAVFAEQRRVTAEALRASQWLRNTALYRTRMNSDPNIHGS